MYSASHAVCVFGVRGYIRATPRRAGQLSTDIETRSDNPAADTDDPGD